MSIPRTRFVTSAAAFIVAVASLAAGPDGKRPLDHTDYDLWNRLSGQSLSNDGKWVSYTLTPGDGDATLLIRAVPTDTEHRITRGSSARFTSDSKYVLLLEQPDPEVIKQQKKDKVPADKQDKSNLSILDLATGETVSIERVKSFRLPDERGAIVAYHLEKPLPPEKAKEEKPKEEKEESKEEGEAKAKPEAKPEAKAEEPAKAEPEPEVEPEPRARTGRRGPRPGGARPGGSGRPGASDDSSDDKPKTKAAGTELVLRNIETGEEHRFADVLSFIFTEDGSHLIYTASTKPPEKKEEAKDDKKGEEEPREEGEEESEEEGEEAHEDEAVAPEEPNGDGVYIVDTSTGKARPAMTGLGHYKSLALSEEGNRLAFLSDRDDYEAIEPAWTLYAMKLSDGGPAAIATDGTEGIPEGSWIADSRGPSFSESGNRLYFGTAPKPEPEPEADEEAKEADDEDEDPEIKLDIWHWKDPQLQPQQIIVANRNRNPSYTAVAHLDDDNRIVQLEDEDFRGINVGNNRDADVAIMNDREKYAMASSWESPGFVDVYLVDPNNGERELILKKFQGNASLSPDAKYVTWWDYQEQDWFSRSVKTGKVVNLTKDIPHPMHNVLHDTPSPARAAGSAGWTEGDAALLLYDRFDIWAVDPAGFWPPRCITEGYGRKHDLRFRITRLDREQDAYDPDEQLLLNTFHLYTKASGAYRDSVKGDELPQKIVMLDERLSTPTKAKNADTLMFTRSRFEMYPDLWASDMDFSDPVRLSDANPQQADFTWGTAEIVEWTSLDGDELQGILYKPEGFDPEKQYPMIVYFYERSSDGLHGYTTPAPGSSSINRSFYVSRGYLVFVPDIPYRTGYPGQSAVNAILPGIASLIDKGFVDKDHIGTQGHSWGGYQTAFLVTKTDMFAAAESGAPVSNMTSAYGGIRWGSGMSRMFQYEQTQSRIGGTLWEAQTQYFENSPVFRADKINTPLLILHNDKDGAVPWYQGIELFVAMRRLGRPAWLFNYNGEDHGLRQKHNRKDWTIRMQQFFDHYLKDAAPPVWLAEGIPAKEKGKNLGLDLIVQEKDGEAEMRRRD